MAAKQEVTLVVSARDRTRAVFRRIARGFRRLRLGFASLIGGAAFGALTRGALDFASAIDGASERLDVSRETLQALRLQADALNIPFETLQGVIQRISRNAGQALSGDSRMAENFAKLGITFEELSRLNTEDLFFAVADAAADTSRSWRETSALIAKIGDTEAVRLRGLLVQGGDALARGANALVDAGKVQTDEQIVRQAEINRQTAEAYAEAQAEFARVMVSTLPAFTEAISRLADLLELIQGAGQDIADPRGLRPGQAAAELGTEALVQALPLGAVETIIKVLNDIAINTKDAGRMR